MSLRRRIHILWGGGKADGILLAERIISSSIDSICFQETLAYSLFRNPLLIISSSAEGYISRI